MTFDKWFVYLCVTAGLGLSVWGLIRSIQNHENIVSDIIGLFLWTAFLVATYFGIKKKEKRIQEKTNKSN